MEVLTASTTFALDAAALPLLADFLGNALNILWVAVGLGLVIFFHELGHFAVAKWCDVNVERFSIGFGPILWSFKKGETEYALSAIPFGGYVKMLGQDDMDPSQLSSEEIAKDPRSYSAKPVRQRMAIISAGVVMNIITAMLFFAVAFSLGVEMPPAELGGVQTGMPAWMHGLEQGDRITRIGDRRIEAFPDIMRAVALTTGPVTIEGVRRDGTTFEMTLEPDETGSRRLIGAAPQPDSLIVSEPGPEKIPIVWPGTPAANAETSFRPNDRIETVDGQPVPGISWLQAYMAGYDARSRPVTFGVRRASDDGGLEEITLAPQRFRTLGLRMQLGRIEAVQLDSPAARAGLQKGDKITHVDGLVVGTELDPMELPDYLARRAGQPVTLTVIKEADPTELSIQITPRDEPAWVSQPTSEKTPLAADSIGIAYHVVPTVQDVRPDSPAAKAGIEPGERIRQVDLVRPEKAPPPLDFINIVFDKDVFEVPLKDGDGKALENWSYAFWLIQMAPTRNVRLHVSDRNGKDRQVVLTPQPADRDWFYPDMRGVRLEGLLELEQADNVVAAMGMGFTHTKNWAIDIYLTLRNLVTGRISPKELHGPVGIAKVAYKFAEQGIADLLLFLGMLSVNLAVLNFLPIPVLDGGHMAFLVWEGVTRKKPSEKVLVAATYVGFAFVVGLMLAVLYLDIFVHGAG